MVAMMGIYNPLKSFLYDDSDYDPAIGYSIADEVMKEEWDDPKMGEYDRYEEFLRLKGKERT